MITDNAANMRAAWRLLQKDYPLMLFLPCLSHTIQLLVGDICENSKIESFLKKARKVAKYFRKKHYPAARLAEKARRCGLTSRRPKLPGKTRWGSQLIMLESLLKLRAPLEKIARAAEDGLHTSDRYKWDRSILKFIRSSTFWRKVKAIISLLKLPVDLLDRCQSDKPGLMEVEAYKLELGRGAFLGCET